uniref:Reverse transcriptase zinc-binding domain-containing protein n=1 Tax=Quercus lobata TaxID=97700 RepID=A0A7N2LJ47_QUELO
MQRWKENLLSQAEAPVHPKCSFAWRSILQARDVINKGEIWRIRDGGSINIWEHNWLTDPANSRIVSPRINNDVVYVKDLFYANTRIWDPGQLERNFLPWEAEVVRRIPVSEGSAEDVLIWPLTQLDGNYSVQSAYKMSEADMNSQKPSSSSMDGGSRVWKGIWKIRTPNRIRHFVWRAARDSLPTKQNLKLRHIPIDDTCALCGEYQESLMHHVWLCEQAQLVWHLDLSFAKYYRKPHRSFFDLLKEVMINGSGYHVALFSTISWSTVQASPVRWSHSLESLYKINSDAALFENLGLASIKVVIRDSIGEDGTCRTRSDGGAYTSSILQPPGCFLCLPIRPCPALTIYGLKQVYMI